MTKAKKAHCPAPGAVLAACRNYWAANQPQSLAKAGAALISEGIALLSDATPDAPKLVEACRRHYPAWVTRSRRTSRLPCASRRASSSGHAFASFQELYLEAILGSLIKRGFMSRKLDVTTGS